MRTLIVPILAMAAVTFVACGRQDHSRLSHDAHAVAADLKSDVRRLASNDTARKAGAEIKHTAHQAADALRHTGAEVKHAVKK